MGMNFTGGNLEIRLATYDDLPALLSLEWSTGLPSKFADRLALQDAGHMEYPIALLDGTIVGYLLLKWNCPEDPLLKEKLPPCAEIEDLAVIGEWQRHGIGSRLLAFADDRARLHGEGRIGLAVDEANTGARSLYERRGYREMELSQHDVTWLVPQEDGDSVIAGASCIYMMKDL
jgi:ribosomal protein S18 acetylase RimI-like enzyme